MMGSGVRVPSAAPPGHLSMDDHVPQRPAVQRRRNGYTRPDGGRQDRAISVRWSAKSPESPEHTTQASRRHVEEISVNAAPAEIFGHVQPGDGSGAVSCIRFRVDIPAGSSPQRQSVEAWRRLAATPLPRDGCGTGRSPRPSLLPTPSARPPRSPRSWHRPGLFRTGRSCPRVARSSSSRRRSG